MAAQAEIWTFPTDPAEFDNDDRISFSKLDKKYLAVQDDGTEFEFDEDLRRWVPVMDEALIQEQQSGYMPVPQAGSSRPGPDQGRKKRKNESNDREDIPGRSKAGKRQATRQAPQPKQNTAVYVTGLPLDVTVEEVHELFSRKCGVIAEEIDSGRPRIKLYTDADGRFKGDALVVFFKPQSVEMAIMLLDDTDFRFTPSGTSTGKLRVQAADLSYKKTNYDDNDNTEAGGSGIGSAAERGEARAGSNGDKGKNAPRRNGQDKQKIIRKTQKLDAKLADWDDEPSSLYPESKGGRWDKVVILSHMFTLQELEEDPTAILDIKEDIREECEKLGVVTNVVLFDLEEEGIVSVKFQSAEAADACVKLMHGRSFAGRTVEAYFATGRERFRKTKEKGDEEGEESE